MSDPSGRDSASNFWYHQALNSVWVRLARNLAGAIALSVVVGVGAVTVDDLQEVRDEVRVVTTQQQQDHDRLLSVADFVADPIEKRPINDQCLCVNETPAGPDFEFALCRIAWRCDAQAIEDCERSHLGFKCKAYHPTTSTSRVSKSF